MSKAQLKEALRQKIDSQEKLLEILKGTGYERTATGYYSPADEGLMMESPSYLLRPNIANATMGAVQWRPDTKMEGWWWYREQMRLAVGLYPERTETLTLVIHGFSLFQYAIHPSTDPDNPYGVAYTPDGAMGQADRQVRVSSLAKLIKKLCILVTDDHAQRLEAAHRAELDPSFELATTPEEVQYVYQNMEGDSGCMRYDGESRWDLPEGFHPSHVYSAPGIGVAYHKRGDAIASRAVVFEVNGAKHYLRIYGDAALRRKLEKNGYTPASLAGAKIARIKVEDKYGSPKVMVPYIDGLNGDQSNDDGTYGYIDKNEPDFIQLVTSKRAQKLSNAGISVMRFKEYQNVLYTLGESDLSLLQGTCPLTGITYDATSDSTLLIYHLGQIKRALHLPGLTDRFNDLFAAEYGGQVTWAEPGYKTFGSNLGRVLDTDANRMAAGFVKLDPALYPNDKDWHSVGSLCEVDGKFYKLFDCVKVYGLDERRYVPASAVETRQQKAALREQGYWLNGRGQSRYLIHKDHSHARQTLRGDYVHRSRSSLIELAFGVVGPASGSVEVSTRSFGLRAYPDGSKMATQYPMFSRTAVQTSAILQEIVAGRIDINSRKRVTMDEIVAQFDAELQVRTLRNQAERLRSVIGSVRDQAAGTGYYGENYAHRVFQVDTGGRLITERYENYSIEELTKATKHERFQDHLNSETVAYANAARFQLLLVTVTNELLGHLKERLAAVNAQVEAEETAQVEALNAQLVAAGMDPIPVAATTVATTADERFAAAA